MSINLDGRHFTPIQNSKHGRVGSETTFIFQQSGKDFTASYIGNTVSDGHIIGKFTDSHSAQLIYHSRSSEGKLEAGEALASFKENEDKLLEIEMEWSWLNHSKKSGTSQYLEDIPNRVGELK